MDLRNLGGLNAKLGHTRTNDVFSKIAGLIRLFLAGAGQDPVFFRHGGDEMSAIIVASDERRLQTAIQKIMQAVQELAEQFGLQETPHPKHLGDPRFFGIGVHLGVVEIRPEHASKPQAVFQEADVQLEQNKKAPLSRSSQAG
jgi:diguanylate cyclase (GGDEF)-like protein